MPCSKTRPRNRLIGRVGGDQSLTVAKWSKSELLGRGPIFCHVTRVTVKYAAVNQTRLIKIYKI